MSISGCRTYMHCFRCGYNQAILTLLSISEKCILFKESNNGIRRINTSVFKESLFNDQNGICGICGQPMSLEEEIHVDHIIPKSRGGTDNINNLQAAHSLCNLKKSDQIIE